jgi:predicted MPP superfamily phosphohydrolase
MNPDKAPIFIVACPRSGTTVLAALLNKHSNIASATETHFFNYVSKLKIFKKFTKQAYCRNFLSEIFAEPRIADFCEVSGISRDEFAKALEPYLGQKLSDKVFFDLIMSLFLTKKHKPRFCEKTPQHLLCVNKILELYPKAKIIHVVRDGRDVVNSLLKMPWRPKGLLNNARFWIRYARLGQQLNHQYSEAKENFMSIRYEDLLLNTEKLLREILSFVEEAYEEGILDKNFQEKIFASWENEWKHKSAEGIDPSRIGAYRKELSLSDQAALNSILKKTLIKLKYVPDQDSGGLVNKIRIINEYSRLICGKFFRIFAVTLIWLCMLACPQPALALGKPDIIRGPYLQSLSKNSVVIKWRTDKPCISYLKYGADAGQLDVTAMDQMLKTDHEIRLQNLKPETKYFYAVAAYHDGKRTFLTASKKQKEYFFITQGQGMNANKPLHIWVLGDAGTASTKSFGSEFRTSQADVRDAYYRYQKHKPHTDLILMLGDNAYYSGTDEEYQKAVFEIYSSILINTPLYPVLGNHEERFIKDQNGYSSRSYPNPRGVYFDSFSLPQFGELGGIPSGTEAFYSFDLANTHFIMLDSYDSAWEDLADNKSNFGEIWEAQSAQPNRMIEWLRKDLEAADKNPNTKWIIVSFHHPPYSNKAAHQGKKDDDENLFWQYWMRRNILPILEKYHVDLVLSGHVHRYERTLPLRGFYSTDVSVQTEMIKSLNRNQYTKGSGTIYLTVGSSGAVFKNKAPREPYFVESIEKHGSLVLDINDKELNVKFIDNSNKILDYFTIYNESQHD